MARENLLGIPTRDFNRIYDDFGFSILRAQDTDFNYSIHDEGSIESFAFGQEIVPWIVDLSNRITQATWSGIGLVYWKELGIPDDRDRISPGSNGESIQYFPDFGEEHWFNLAMSSFFSSVFHSKIYAAWDNIGQILNLMYDLKIARVDFHKAVDGLAGVRLSLHVKLKAVIDSDPFQKLKTLRHDTTHNELPTGVSGMVAKIPDGYSFGGGAYNKTADIQANALEVLTIFNETLRAIRQQIALDS